MNCDALVDITLAIGRVVVLTLGMLSGTLLTYLGWKLYADGVVSRSKGEFGFKDLKVALTATGPGVFLALFGTFLIWSIVSRPLDLSERTSTDSPAKQPTIASPPSAVPSFGARLITVQAATKGEPAASFACPPCLVRQKTRVLFGGGEPPTAKEIEFALGQAIDALDKSVETSATPKQKATIRRQIDVLEEVREGVRE